MRGKLDDLDQLIQLGGLIPAHAGKTPDLVHIDVNTRAHPRACGENETGEVKERLVFGSSPRMRGKPRFGGTYLPGRGLIPAHAGKTIGQYERSDTS